jgi:hypothetical protein
MLPDIFQFSQGSLQDYVDCPRRFQLRYVNAQLWPAVQAEPVLEHERRLELGSRFHRLVERHQLGISEKALTASLASAPDELRAWWQAYLRFDLLHTMPGPRYPEQVLSAELAGARLVAKLDLLAVEKNERVYIFDWKTYNSNFGTQWFLIRIQTRLYRWITVTASASLLKRPVAPPAVSMVYWLAGMGGETVVLDYDQETFEDDTTYLAALVQEIQSRSGDQVWELTANERRCRFCEYRSLCNRGEAAGPVQELQSDLDQLAECVVLLGLDDVEEVGF